MHISSNAPLYPLIQGSIWELPAVHQMLAALDECHLARQQNLMVSGEEQQYALAQLQRAEHELLDAKTELLRVLEELPAEKNYSAVGTLIDIEAAWESNLLLPAGGQEPNWHHFL